MKSTEPVNLGTPEYRKKKDSALLESLRVNLVDFFNEMVEERWFAKERELVSRFTFTKLIGMSGCCESFFSPAQISIETRGKQVTEAGKNEVAKDMIIWKDINQTAWSQDPVPLLIVEWKHNETTPFQSDINWLKLYTSRYNDCTGITVNIDNKINYSMHASLIQNGEVVEYDWIKVFATN